MPLHPTLADDPPTARRFRRCAPLLLALALMAGTLAPGLIAGDRPFQTSLCGDLGRSLRPCGQTEVAASASADESTPSTGPAPAIP